MIWRRRKPEPNDRRQDRQDRIDRRNAARDEKRNDRIEKLKHKKVLRRWTAIIVVAVVGLITFLVIKFT